MGFLSLSHSLVPEYGTYKTVTAGFWPWRSVKRVVYAGVLGRLQPRFETT
jgi:hypothetical protein